MKKVLLKIWHFVNLPIVDIVAGYIMAFIAVFICYYFSELTVPCVVAFVSGSLIAIGFDCVDHGFNRYLRSKSSAAADENK